MTYKTAFVYIHQSLYASQKRERARGLNNTPNSQFVSSVCMYHLFITIIVNFSIVRY